MKLSATIARILVGLLFIFSGLVKANDPHGLSYKMQEFFEIWGTEQFNSWTLALSVCMNAFEIIAGFALLLGWQIRLFSWLLLLLIVFFTFLTGYTYITGKPTNCGCFGDCLPISSRTSFLKDVALTLLIAFLLFQRRHLRPLFRPLPNTVLMLLVILFSFGFQWYTLHYLPVVDCLPYKKQKNITEQMKMPANAIPDSTVITYVYSKDGKTIEFTADQFPADFATPPYVFVKRYDKVIRKGSNNLPPVRGFVLTGISGIDSTSAILSRPYAVLLFCEDFSTPVATWQKHFEPLYAATQARNIPVYIITTRMAEAQQQFAKTPFSKIPVFACDYTAVRTAARSNPTVYLLQGGTVIEKQAYPRIDRITARVKYLASIPADKTTPANETPTP